MRRVNEVKRLPMPLFARIWLLLIAIMALIGAAATALLALALYQYVLRGPSPGAFQLLGTRGGLTASSPRQLSMAPH